MFDVDSIKGCAVQSETVFHCSEASQSTTKVTKHSAATAGQLPLGTGREFAVDQRRNFRHQQSGDFTDIFFHSHLDRYRRTTREAETGPDQPDNPEDGREDTGPSAQRHVPIIQKIQKIAEAPQEQLWTVPRILKFQETVEYATGPCDSESRRPCMSDRYRTWT